MKMPNHKNRDKKKVRRQPTTKEMLFYWISHLNKQFTIAKIALDECERARININLYAKKMGIEDATTIKVLTQTIKKMSKCPHCGKSIKTSPIEKKKASPCS